MSDLIWVILAAAGVVLLAYVTMSGPDHARARATNAGGPGPDVAKGAKAPVKDAATSASNGTASTVGKAESQKAIAPASETTFVRVEYEEDAEVEPTKVGDQPGGSEPRILQPPTQKILYDEDAAADEPTHSGALILVSATAQTDRGLRRKRNEDNLLVMPDESVFVVADGMGGYNGGEIASELAVRTIETAFSTKRFLGERHSSIPGRASELALAIQMANEAVRERAAGDKMLDGMGTTVVAARFSPNKQRLYVGHVGDSRLYRLRQGELRQMTSDHTMRDLGVVGDGAGHLSRAVGVWPTVPIDVILGKPLAGDTYLLCSDGLTKMISDDRIREILASGKQPNELVEELVKAANDAGGRDNVTVIVVSVRDPLKPS